jgi:hypothetical protein
MTSLRVFLAALWAILAGYTAVVISRHGTGLLNVFFGDMAKLGWPGQFNLDFMILLALSALWVAWRHRFTAAGLALAVLAFFLGALFLTTYLLVLNWQAKGDVREMLVGRERATG